MKSNKFFSHFHGNFLTGLAIVLPAAITVLLLIWGYDTVAKITDAALFFLPKDWTHADGGQGRIRWYWSLGSLAVTIILVALAGHFGRYYIGRQIIDWADQTLMQIPLLNKIYSAVKQVNDAFSSNKSSFKQVVLVEFPHPGAKAIGFLTGEHRSIIPNGETQVSVFIPTTPNPTSGFLILVPETSVTKLNMSVAEGIKFTISLGAIAPEILGQPAVPPLLSPPIQSEPQPQPQPQPQSHS
jgi:uncharacterized membrane protein